MKRIALVLTFVLACGVPVQEEALGETSSNITMPGCGTALNDVDGIYAYSNGWAEATGDSCAGQSGDGTLLYQCVEFAQRYFNQKFGIQKVWPVQYAAQMCSANPAGTTVHWLSSGYQPKHGDLVVWQGHTFGHVAVVKSASAGSVTIVEQNGGWSAQGTRMLSAGDSYGYAACFISANGNSGEGIGTASGACGYGDGLYCGGNGGGADTNTLYRCVGGNPAVSERCANGCEIMPAGKNDRCKPSGGATASSCPNGFGRYCGGNGVEGDANTLYDCQPSGRTIVQKCATSCVHMPVGRNDVCN